MSVKVNGPFWICQDCLFFLANGDLPEDEESAAAVLAGVEAVAPGHWALGSKEREFSWSFCACCDSGLGGSRHEASIVTQEEEPQHDPANPSQAR